MTKARQMGGREKEIENFSRFIFHLNLFLFQRLWHTWYNRCNEKTLRGHKIMGEHLIKISPEDSCNQISVNFPVVLLQIDS